MLDDVIWWHENTNGVYSCCSDSINTLQKNGLTTFDFELNKKHLNLMAGRLSKYAIRVGIENSFAGKFTVEVCDDILSGKYFSNIYDPKQTDALLISRDKINSAWATLE